MAYVDLTDSERAAIQDVLNILRPSVGEMQRTVRIWQEIGALNTDVKSEWKVAFNKLLAPDMIPNTTSLAGAGQVTRGEVASMLVDIAAVVTTWQEATRLGLCVRLAGINAE